jgi:hypothetical protein
MTAWLIRVRSHGLARRAIILTAAVLLAFALAAPVIAWRGGSPAIYAAGVAAALSWAGATFALVAAHVLRGPELAFTALGVATAGRLGIPLLAGLAIHLQGGPLAEAGLLYYLLLFYPVALTVEIALSLPPRARPASCRSISPDA